MITDADFLDVVAIHKPQIALYGVFRVHRGEELHVLAHLVVVLGFGGTELEIDHNPFVAIGHNAVWAALLHLAILDRENGALVEECPTF